MEKEYQFIFDHQKNSKLRETRGIGFEDVIYAIESDRVLDIMKHPNDAKYPGQWIMVVELNNYAYQVPYCIDGDSIKLITIFPSRKCTKRYIKEAADG